MNPNNEQPPKGVSGSERFREFEGKDRKALCGR